ncbi:MAG: hypothetical protein MRY79_00005, partial [Alphaproteobacteria bacterium]|nr:hypothetical protein [Alphaproteobacteria bacterium]
MASPHIDKIESTKTEKTIGSQRELSVVPDDLPITKEGIKDYLWPVSHQELLDFGQELEHELSSFFKNYPDQDKVLAYKIASKNYVTTIAGCFQGEFLAHRLKQNNLTLKMPDDWQVWPNIFAGLPPPVPTYLKPLYLKKKQDGLAHRVIQKLLNPSEIFKLFKKLNLEKGKGLSIDGLKIGKPDNSKLEQAIIA